MTLFLRLAVLAGAFVVASVALAQTAVPAKVADTSKGKALVDAKGMTLYTFDRDAAGKSACNGLSYVVTAKAERAQLLPLAATIYKQFEAANDPSKSRL